MPPGHRTAKSTQKDSGDAEAHIGADHHPSLYRDPSVYDILHAPGTAEELTSIEHAAVLTIGKRALSRTALWLEPACGTGRLLRLNTRRGRRSIGFDLDDSMIGYAIDRSNALSQGRRASYLCADMTAFAEPLARVTNTRPMVAMNTINSIRHLPSDDAMRQHLSEMAGVLSPKGVYIVGLSTSGYGIEQPSEDVWKAARGTVRVTQIVQYEPPADPTTRLESVTSHLIIERPSGTEHADSCYALRTYSLEEWHELIESSSMRIAQVFDAHGDLSDAAVVGYRLYALVPRD